MDCDRGSASSLVTRRFRVLGKVQGVYFRHSTRLEAERLGVCGVARNLKDGTVEVIAQGAHAAVASLHAWLHHGPKSARVANVQELDPPAPGPESERGWPDFGIE